MKKHAFFSLILTLFVSLLVGSCGTDSDTEKQTQKVLLVSFDGFMNQYLDRNPTPNFDRFIESGTRAEYLVPVFPTKTFPNHYSLATGLLVENHGIISNSFPDDSLGARFSYGPPDGSPNDERWWEGEPIWITAENQGKTSATMFWPGSEASIDGVQPTKWKPYDGSVDNYARIDSVMSWLNPSGETDADFATLYFSDVDSRGHSFGPESDEVDESVVQADSLVGYLWDSIEAAGLRNELNVIIVSDHGMAELSDDRVIFLDELIDLGQVEIVDMTPVAMLKPLGETADQIYRALKENEQNYRVYKKEDLPARYGFTNHYRIPEIIMIADVGYTITSRDFYEDRGLIAATHGFDHEAPEMRTIFMANGPAFPAGQTIPPISALDLYEMMAHLLHLEPANNDGKLPEILD
ncbi:MAG: alkaline phosphatase family protein [Bacteroidetes bacterium]|jgi:predicted AlkP superfamily pyrophosphatase or phosphodiesterase|nr:alkaline phosphatase family protein [Bacteroidota bacterium]